MGTLDSATDWLDLASVDSAVFALRPDYRALLIVAEQLVPGESDVVSEALLADAETLISTRLEDQPLDEFPELLAWREAYRAFGSKPQRFRPSVEALVRRVGDGLPRIDRITDTYNAISVAHLLPLGGEDADRYSGAARLFRADGSESFELMSSGERVVEHPEPGEVVWGDDDGVTCRRWNWRQSLRTRITGETTRALFILDSLAEVTPHDRLAAAGAALREGLAAFSPEATFTSRMIEPA
ncbi:MAG TPA: phenylalanine--tRNA ligase beta subunit-related protein [Galbitalea sp.]|jgi:DNA/RNA-binding domain of Phe-tRNA-synthetase-like protein